MREKEPDEGKEGERGRLCGSSEQNKSASGGRYRFTENKMKQRRKKKVASAGFETGTCWWKQKRIYPTVPLTLLGFLQR